ncbi:TusE/DsrC/DsvC family sulfur relay protein [Gilvimarinus sp. SDUM040013]|uniref:Sulfurtransferase n=1 Tax=Gilvimarinus gilvus TaxID=3058038 RepID=A0ABU4RWY4_9GAMM|nr:TusE/DsrC/DsvC family sulfur relay protein [Gilvimarinus sp. SDUM040013]MDO3385733.1 TusE/DsrC/DsvC family sulfur relay protein [Gilvimarinus sp. SDUM040013]MDX6849373.1 TusE/DsrC/DsvC family sulfur relay protein [Gilvimarinus sp. SDUM040013]
MADSLPALDKDGYLLSLGDWSGEVAAILARNEGITLTAQHWEIIELIQAFYKDFELAPANRALVRYIQQTLGGEKGKSIYLMQLFPPNPALIAAKIAGLPRPANCF